LSYRDVEELLAERGVTVDHVTVYRWVQRFTPEFIEAARPRRHVPGDRWFVDETYVKVNRGWTYLYRGLDQSGQVIDVLLSARRDLTAARTFFTRALATGVVPVEVTTDRAPAYPRVLDELVPAHVEGVAMIAGKGLVRWLQARNGNPIDEASASDLLSRIEAFRSSAWSASTRS
jgi:transposase-like protein